MKKLIVQSNHISFCFGVKKSLDLIDNIINSKKYNKIYMLGEIIHNKQVIEELNKKGLITIKDVNKIPDIPKDSIVIIQSHGVSPKIYNYLKQKKINYIDSTCPLVKKIHKSIVSLEKEGYYPVILGSKKHTEVKGIAGYTKNKPIIISSKEEINSDIFKNINKAGIVMQSTFFYDKVDEILNEIKKYVKSIKVIDTICEPTKSRQREIKEKSSKFNSVIVIGSHNSSNTKKLYTIAKSKNENTFFITSEKDIKNLDFKNLVPVFVTSGASAPIYLINNIKDEILKKLNKFYCFYLEYKNYIEKEIISIFENEILKIEKFKKDEYYKFFNNPYQNDNFIEIKNIINALKDYCLRPGKRIRPLLLLWGFLAFNSKNKKYKKPYSSNINYKKFNKIFKIAALIEIMHSFLLIHDDIIDRSDLRRGKPSFHKVMEKYFLNSTYNKNIGTDIALVAGDILFFIAIEIISEINITKKSKDLFLNYFAKCYKITGYGQIFDSLGSKLKIINQNKNYSSKVNILKTSYYTIFYPIVMGYALTGKIDKNELENIKNIAIPLGEAFQLRDDIISIFGKSDKTGKPNTTDIEEGKMTAIIEQTLKLLKGEKLDKFKNIFIKENKTKDDINFIKNMIIESKAIDIIKEEINLLYNKSLNFLTKLAIDNYYKKIIIDMIEYLKDF